MPDKVDLHVTFTSTMVPFEILYRHMQGENVQAVSLNDYHLVLGGSYERRSVAAGFAWQARRFCKDQKIGFEEYENGFNVRTDYSVKRFLYGQLLLADDNGVPGQVITVGTTNLSAKNSLRELVEESTGFNIAHHPFATGTNPRITEQTLAELAEQGNIHAAGHVAQYFLPGFRSANKRAAAYERLPLVAYSAAEDTRLISVAQTVQQVARASIMVEPIADPDPTAYVEHIKRTVQERRHGIHCGYVSAQQFTGVALQLLTQQWFQRFHFLRHKQ
ncbi:MAG: hypothetical protein OXR66_00420 [Candidatus Woesearchaeota archaeon]|nr:hypothetical protein [Candidatus Woesearchaeota archaeon]